MLVVIYFVPTLPRGRLGFLFSSSQQYNIYNCKHANMQMKEHEWCAGFVWHMRAMLINA